MKNIKKFTVALLLALAVFTIDAQTDRGKFLIGGSSSFSVMFNSTKSHWNEEKNDQSSLSISLVPQLGIFVIEGLAIGLQLESNFSMDFYELGGTEYTSISSLDAIAPFVKYFFGSSKFRPYAQAAVGIGYYTSQTVDEADSKSKALTYLLQPKGGVCIFLKENVALDAGLSFTWDKFKGLDDWDYESTDSTIGLEVGFILIL